MAVDARQRQLNLYPRRIISDRELIMDGFEGLGTVYAAPVGYELVPPFSGTAAVETVYGGAAMVPAKAAAVKSESGVSYAVPASRKRSRDVFNQMDSLVANQAVNNCFVFLGEDLSLHFVQQQLEIDRFITEHTENLRLEIEERRKQFARRIAATVHANTLKRLKSKDEEIDKMRKLNFAMQERLKSLSVENQILKELAQTNEATANALRCNLEQVLAQVQDEHLQDSHHRANADAESCCGETDTDDNQNQNQNYEFSNVSSSRKKMCRSCGKEESCVLLLPCRHLCLCTVCGSSLHTCPVCNSAKTASVHVNLSS